MKPRWPALLLPLSLVSAWACSSDPDPAPPSGTGGSSGAGAGGSSASAGVAPTAGHTQAGSTAAGAAGDAGQGGQGGQEAASGAAGEGSGAGTVGNAGSSGSAGGGGTSGGAGNSGNAGGGGAAPTPGELLGPGCVGCTVTALGVASWNLEGVMIALAPSFGSASTGVAPLYTWLSTVLGPSHQLYVKENQYGPGTPHAGPYGSELYTLFTAASTPAQQTFTAAQFGAPTGVVILMNAVPNALAPLGSSPDFASGRIIPNSLFPILVDGDLRRNGAMYDKDFDWQYRALDKFETPILKDGASHLLLWFGENSSFVPSVTDPKGNYDFELSVVDSSGVGWVVHVPFVVR